MNAGQRSMSQELIPLSFPQTCVFQPLGILSFLFHFFVCLGEDKASPFALGKKENWEGKLLTTFVKLTEAVKCQLALDGDLLGSSKRKKKCQWGYVKCSEIDLRHCLVSLLMNQSEIT